MASNMQDLDVSLRDELDAAFRAARAALEAGNRQNAIEMGEAAWARFPAPKFDWDVSKSYTHALALIYRDTGRWTEAIRLMDELFASGTVKPHQDGPRFVLGTIYYEMGDMIQAQQWFKEADKISKGRCFNGQPEKYRQAVAKKPASLR
jgi:tetratricopeptide (TPR) repeat protein